MSEEEINNYPNYPNNSYRTTDDYHKQQQNVVTGGQLEQISKFLLECPEAALNVHKYLQKHYGDQQQQLFTSVNPTSKRDRPLDDSGESISNENRRWKQCRRGYHQNIQNYTSDARCSTRYEYTTPSAIASFALRCTTATASFKSKFKIVQTSFL